MAARPSGSSDDDSIRTRSPSSATISACRGERRSSAARATVGPGELSWELTSAGDIIMQYYPTVTVDGGSALYGLAVGVLMLDTQFPRALGDVGNANTWPFPVTYHIVEGAIPERMAQPEPDPSLLSPFVEGVRRLERDGVRAIITSCGFLAAHQPELAAAASVPVFSSPLLQVPLAARAIRPGAEVAI